MGMTLWEWERIGGMGKVCYVRTAGPPICEWPTEPNLCSNIVLSCSHWAMHNALTKIGNYNVANV